jgi:2-polyprenyl-6-hydroxyphenyl methylase/3-demethylubiquinone-9 3-methyltransferase
MKEASQSLHDERRVVITTTARTAADLKARQRELWALGDYHRVATDLLWEFGRVLVEACGIYSGQRVLDVAAGTGNVAIRAAERGAQVVASDLTPENFDAGRHEALAHGVELEWVEADAEGLPFDDDEFDVVTSSAGAIFAPRHQAVADQLVRVCRPGGTIGLTAFVPAGLTRDLFAIIERYSSPSPPDALSPLLWGSEDHVRGLFDNRVESLEITRKKLLVERFADPIDFRRFLRENHPVFVGLYERLADDPGRVATADRELAEAATRWNRGGPDAPTVYEIEYLLILARKPRSLRAASPLRGVGNAELHQLPHQLSELRTELRVDEPALGGALGRAGNG